MSFLWQLGDSYNVCQLIAVDSQHFSNWEEFQVKLFTLPSKNRVLLYHYWETPSRSCPYFCTDQLWCKDRDCPYRYSKLITEMKPNKLNKLWLLHNIDSALQIFIIKVTRKEESIIKQWLARHYGKREELINLFQVVPHVLLDD